MTSLTKEPCKENIHCKAKVWYIDGKPYSVSRDQKSLDLHECKSTPESTFPEKIYVGVFRNENTGRVRYVGPTKKEENARKVPDSYRRWKLVEILMCAPEIWTPLEDTSTVYVSGAYGRRTRIQQ